MKKIAASLLALSLCSPFVSANTFSTDLSDLWWNSSESGWGVTATHQREVVFLTFFVYGADNKPIFYTGEATLSGQTTTGAIIYTGPMLQTNGPWFGSTFNPNLVARTPVGTVTFTASVEAATLTYTVNGTVVTKALTRQTFRNNDLTGNYAGIFRETFSGCASPPTSGVSETAVGIAISNTANTLAMTTNQNGFVCNFFGNYRQNGRMGASTGVYNCSGVSGSYDMTEIEANVLGVTGRYTAQDNVCAQTSTKFAILKR
jgi:hypothetical protein